VLSDEDDEVDEGDLVDPLVPLVAGVLGEITGASSRSNSNGEGDLRFLEATIQ